MWSSKGAQLKTVNLCNQFLVIHLTKKKSQFQKIGMDRKAQAYGTAISSIKKYPLPIICLEQLKSLYGIGQLLSQELLAVIKHHYKAFLKQGCDMPSNNIAQNLSEEVGGEQSLHSMTVCKSMSLAELPKRNKKQVYSQQIEDDSRSVMSCKSATLDKLYKPRPKTSGAFIIQILWKCGEAQFFSRETVVEQLKVNYNTKMTHKNLLLLLSNLLKSGYIQKDSEDYTFIKLTKKGQKQAELLQTKVKQKSCSIKIKSILKTFISNQSVRQKPTTLVLDRELKKNVEYDEQIQLILLIDIREMKDKIEQTFFQKKMVQKYGLKCKTCNLPIGDFMWEYNNQILDYVVERKTADDFMSSIYDGRYKQQKYRLRNSGFQNIFYLFQGHLTANFAKNQRQVYTGLLKTRVNDGFKVVTVNNITESMKFINFITEQIRKKLFRDKRLTCLGTIEQVSTLNGKMSQLTVQNIFGLSLKTIAGVGKNSVGQVLKHFKCFRQLYDALKQLQSRFQRQQFLRQLLRGCGVRSTLPQLLVDILFGLGKN